MARTKESRTITGVDGAIVYIKSMNYRTGAEVHRAVPLVRGEELPDGLVEGEIERLTDLGVFDDLTPRQSRLAARRARRAAQAALVPDAAGEARVNEPRTPDLAAPPPGPAIETVVGVSAHEAVPQKVHEAADQPGEDTSRNQVEAESYWDLSVVDLRELARDKGVQVSGSKQDLVERLEAADAEEE